MRLPCLNKRSDQHRAQVVTVDNKLELRQGLNVRAFLKCSVAIGAMGLLGGCNTKGWFDPTQVVRSGGPTEPLVVPILSTVDPGLENGPSDFATATPPRPADLLTNNNDYTIGSNDVLNITISDLVGPGQETLKTTRVSTSGNISLPYLGSIRAQGMTEFELEQAIVQAYRDKNLIQNAQVSVVVYEARGRTVEILGAVSAPGQYAILDTEFRLLDALVQAKDTTTPLIDYIYVIRKSENHASATTRPAAGEADGGGGQNSSPAKVPSTAPAPDDLAPKSDAGTAPRDLARSGDLSRPLALLADTPAAPEDLSPTSATTRSSSPPSTLSTTAPMSSSTAPSTGTTQPGGQPFEFNGPDATGSVRIIRIPYGALHAGDLSFNIAIHPRDIIIVQQLPVGEYYMGSHVARPGVYTLSGRRVTLKQAVISAGGFDELAIPQRTDIIRRLKPDREVFVRVDLERIFAGEQPDLYLKPDDQVLVGTNALAPFLAAVRGAFRITYGFGFLYDRNFAYSSNTLGF